MDLSEHLSLASQPPGHHPSQPPHPPTHLAADEGDDGLLVHCGQQHLTPPVERVEAAHAGGIARQEDGVRADAVAVHCGGSLEVVHKQQAQLGNHVHQAILL